MAKRKAPTKQVKSRGGGAPTHSQGSRQTPKKRK